MSEAGLLHVPDVVVGQAEGLEDAQEAERGGLDLHDPVEREVEAAESGRQKVQEVLRDVGQRVVAGIQGGHEGRTVGKV